MFSIFSFKVLYEVSIFASTPPPAPKRRITAKKATHRNLAIDGWASSLPKAYSICLINTFSLFAFACSSPETLAPGMSDWFVNSLLSVVDWLSVSCFLWALNQPDLF